MDLDLDLASPVHEGPRLLVIPQVCFEVRIFVPPGVNGTLGGLGGRLCLLTEAGGVGEQIKVSC